MRLFIHSYILPFILTSQQRKKIKEKIHYKNYVKRELHNIKKESAFSWWKVHKKYLFSCEYY